MNETTSSPRFQFRLWMLFVLTAIVGVCLACPPVAKWGGGFDLTLTIESASKNPVEDVSYHAAWNRAEAEYCLQQPHSLECHFESCEGDAGVFVGYIRSGGTDSYFGRAIDYHYQRFVVVKVEFQDGSQALKLIEVPDGLGPRSLTVDVP